LREKILVARAKPQRRNEWCWDWYDAGYYSVSPTTDPTGPSGSARVVRGGGWDGGADSCRAAIRLSTSPGYAGYNIGFHPVCR